MKLKRQTSGIALVVATLLTTAMPVVSAQSGVNEQSIQGTWRTVVTPRNCQTGDPFTPLAGQFTFHQGGTMAEYGIGPGSSPALRSPGHGVWQRRHGWQLYSFAFTFYRYNTSGALLGSQKITGELELGAGGDTFVTRSVIEVLDVNDVQIGSGCATAAGTRFEFE
jgi:hypothetical protein